MNIEIRKVKENDAFKWHTLMNFVWRDAYKDIFPEDVFIEKEGRLNKKVENFNNEMKNDNENIAYVAEYNGEIVGAMCGCIKSHYEHFSNDYADLIAVYINPKYQGKGIGTNFKNIFEEWAKNNGASKYVIGVLKDNTKARKVYESWGGKLSEYESDFIKFDIGYREVFYTIDL